MALKQATVPAVGRARVTGFPPAVTRIEPPTGIAETMANAPDGGPGGEDLDGSGELDFAFEGSARAGWLLSGCDVEGEDACSLV